MELPDLILPAQPPALSIWNTAINIDTLFPSASVETGSETVSVPSWWCGVNVWGRCRCEPKLYPAQPCHKSSSPIAENWPDTTVFEVPELNVGGPGGRPPKIADEYDDCKKYEFYPVKVWDSIEDATQCNNPTELNEQAANIVDSFSHRLVSNLLMGSSNGNPGLAVHAVEVGSGGPYPACTAIGALHANFHGYGQIVVPWAAIGLLVADNVIRPVVGADGTIAGYQDMWGFDVIVDSGLDGTIGPPTAGPWDGVSPIGPAADLQTAAPGEAWVYITPPVFVGQSDPRQMVTAQLSGDSEPTLGNFGFGFAEAQMIALFNPCGVRAIKIETKKALNCG